MSLLITKVLLLSDRTLRSAISIIFAVGMESISVIVITTVPEEVEMVNEVDSKGCALCLETVVEREKPGEAAAATSKSWDWTRKDWKEAGSDAVSQSLEWRTPT